MTNSAHDYACYAQTDNVQAEKYAHTDFSLSAARVSVRAMAIEEKIRAIIKATGWRQQKLAETLGVSQSTVNRWLAGAEPWGHRRDAIDSLYAKTVPSGQVPDDNSIRGDQDILAMLRRIDGLSERDVDVAFGVISMALKANAAGSEQSDADGRSQPATPRRESSSSR